MSNSITSGAKMAVTELVGAETVWRQNGWCRAVIFRLPPITSANDIQLIESYLKKYDMTICDKQDHQHGPEE
uniref:Uncharacterized protein n=1 Tax=Romanomermis culicivorax TaxID=13658 RepID=A0A915ISJ8_ROMCU